MHTLHKLLKNGIANQTSKSVSQSNFPSGNGSSLKMTVRMKKLESKSSLQIISLTKKMYHLFSNHLT